jgi:hypothetical protein
MNISRRRKKKINAGGGKLMRKNFGVKEWFVEIYGINFILIFIWC